MSRKMVYFSLGIFLLLPRLVVICGIYVDPAPAVLPAYFSSPPAPAVSPAYTPTDNILINCGSPIKDASPDGREWDTESPPIITSSPYIFNTSNATFIAGGNYYVDEIPYSTARIFSSKFTYTIPVSKAGQKFLRLYFYPTYFMFGFDMTKSFFSVDAANHNLLSNFSAFLNLKPPSSTLMKEYVITVNQSRVLEVTFTPSPNSYAFVNGIEIVSIPDNLYIKGNDDAIKMVGQKNHFYINDSMALEKLYRLNVGGSDISSTNDTGMFRSWEKDDLYLFGYPGSTEPFDYSLDDFPINYTLTTPRYTAPEDVYSTARTMYDESYSSYMTWIFEVDSGFIYLLRLYFCEYWVEVNTFNQVVFNIIIHNQTAEQAADIIEMTGGRGVPVYKDYVVLVSDNVPDGMSKTYLWLTLQPNKELNPTFTKTILNGLEIFRLSTSGNLATLNPEFVTSPPPEIKKSRGGNQKNGASHSLIVGACIGGSLGGMVLFLLIVGFLLFRRRREKSQDVHPLWSDKSRSTNTNISSLPSVRSRKFSLEEIKYATSNFDDNFVIGAGGFGNVYKGYLENGTYPVAIKRLNPSSQQGAHEFQTEVKLLSNLRHLHLVPLIGYCNDGGEMILVYDYMANGTLRSHLYRENNHPLSWNQRLQICIGAARGLNYLHTGTDRMIIHRDVKSTNILLDEKMVAKVSDFGLSKIGPSDPTVTHICTIVKGSFGYLDPEYYRRKQITCKSDVYSFGVVLFEVLCARPVIMPELPLEQANLAEWARNCYKKGNLVEIMDKNLIDEIAVESLNKFGEVAYSCLRDQGIDRPSMSDVVWSLEFALQLQKSSEKLEQKVDPNLRDRTVHLLSEAKDYITKIYHNLFSTTTVASTRSGGFKSGIGSVFTDILNLNAR